MKRVLLILAALIGVAAAFAQTTVKIPAQSCSAVVTCQGVQITLPASTPPPTPTPIPTPTGVTWGYQNGVLSWAGDFTQNGTSVDYHHATTSGLNGDTQDILFTSTVNWGMYLPYFAPGSTGYAYKNPGFASLLISIKPSMTGQAFGIYMPRWVGPGVDVDPGAACHIELIQSKYGPPTVAGKWSSYVVPLADLCVTSGATLYKVGIQDHFAGPSSWEMDNEGFL